MRDRNEQQGLHISHIAWGMSCMLLSIQCGWHLLKDMSRKFTELILKVWYQIRVTWRGLG